METEKNKQEKPEEEDLPLISEGDAVKSIKENIQKLTDESLSHEEDVENLTLLEKFVRKRIKEAKKKSGRVNNFKDQ